MQLHSGNFATKRLQLRRDVTHVGFAGIIVVRPQPALAPAKHRPIRACRALRTAACRSNGAQLSQCVTSLLSLTNPDRRVKVRNDAVEVV